MVQHKNLVRSTYWLKKSYINERLHRCGDVREGSAQNCCKRRIIILALTAAKPLNDSRCVSCLGEERIFDPFRAQSCESAANGFSRDYGMIRRVLAWLAIFATKLRLTRFAHEIDEIARRLDIVTVADARHNPLPRRGPSLSWINLFRNQASEQLNVARPSEAEFVQESLTLANSSAKKVKQVLLIPDDFNLSCIHVSEIDEPAFGYLSEQIPSNKQLETKMLKLKQVKIGSKERAQSRNFDRRKALKGLIETIERNPSSDFHLFHAVVEQPQCLLMRNNFGSLWLLTSFAELDLRRHDRNTGFRKR